MKKYLLTTVIIFFASLLALNAQDQEKKKVHLKIVKEENGKVIEIDTVFEGTDKEGLYHFGDIEGMDVNIDSILKEFNIEGHEGMKFIALSDKYHSKDSLKHVWHTIDANMEGDSVKMKKMIFISEDGDTKLVESEENMIFISSGSDDIIREHIIMNNDGKKVKVIKKECGESMVWTSNEDGDLKITEEGNVIIIKTDDETYDILKSERGEKTIIKEVIVEKSGDTEKTIKVIITQDGDHSIVKIEGDEDDLKNVEEKVKIYKYKTDDGKITVKAEIDIEDSKDKTVKKEFKKIKISPNPTEGKFNLEFELSNKESVVVKVNNESGKSVYSKKVKKFKGKFSEEIDISKEEAGTYIVLIKQGDKIIEQKIQKK
ncbi:MAG: T9SS type A sorting domain-containing protein [Bacteroidales bacterium]|nr:T9SS type A sorting domain-containing protein [Bacteroidales bacterium]